MANTMLRRTGSSNLRNEISRFAENIRKSGKNPNDLLNELLNSGKFTPAQIEQAKKMAKLFNGGGI